MKPHHFADKTISLRLMQVAPWEWPNLPIEQKSDKAILFQAMRSSQFVGDQEPAKWLERVMALPALSRDREVLLVILYSAYDKKKIEDMLSIAAARDQINALLGDYDSAIQLIEINEYWFDHIKIPITLPRTNLI